MIYLSDRIMLDVQSGFEARGRLRRLSLALQERFTDVNLDDHIVTSSSDLMALIFRGYRTHPMLPFDTARFEIIEDRQGWSLNYALGLKMQIVIFLYLAIGIGLMASVDRGLLLGMSVGFIFVFFAMTVSLVISARRAKR